MKRARAIRIAALIAIIVAGVTMSYLFRRHKQFLNEQLVIAVTHQDAVAVRSLLAQGADPNGRGEDGKQVLEFLGWFGPTGPTPPQVEICRMLVNAGVEPVTSMYFSRSTDSNPERSETSHLYTFVSLGDIEIMRVMLQRARKYSPTMIDARGLLSTAVSARQLPMLKFLLASGLKPDGQPTDQYDFFPLEIAADEGWVEGVDLLLQSGANPNAMSQICPPPLVAAVRYGNPGYEGFPRHLEIMRMLVAHGASVTQEASLGQTALDVASQAGNVAAVAFLLDHGADIHHTDRAGLTALAWAVEDGNAAVVRLLLARGADPKVRIREGSGATISLVEYAARRHYPEIMSLLKP